MNLDEVMNFGKTIIGGADGPTSVFLAGSLGTTAAVAVIVTGLLICFLGLKLSKILVPITGFLIGAAVGFAVSAVAGANGMTSVIIIFVCAVLLAALSAFLYKPGVFLFVFTAVLVTLASLSGISGALSFTIVSGGDMVVKCIVLGAALVLAVLAVIFVEPVVVITTAVSGGMAAGPMILAAAGFYGQIWMGYLAGAVLAVLGMLTQFMMHSRKVGKKEKIYSDEIKEKDSVESEVEKARTVLEEDEEEE